MTSTQLYNLLARHWKTLVTTIVAAALFGLVVSGLMPVKYRANMELLILQRYAFARDAYTASKSIEYLSAVFGEAIYSQNFIDEVLKSGFRIENKFSANPQRMKKEWKKIVKAKVSRDTGILSVSVTHRSAEQAQQIAEAIASIIETKGDQYHGEGDRVKIQTLDTPYLEEYPSQPNIPANMAAAMLIAVVAVFTLLAAGYELEFTPSSIKRFFFPPEGEAQSQAVPEAPSVADQFTPATPQYAYETVETPYVTARQPTSYPATAGPRPGGGSLQATSSPTIGFDATRPIEGKSVNEIKKGMGWNSGER